MLIAIVFVVLLVMFGNNPVDRWRAEREKYGSDPLAREINKFNEEQSKKGTVSRQYKPPPGSLTYRLPPDQAQIPASNPFTIPGDEEHMVHPAPDVPIEEWSSPYPQYMLAPRNGTDNALGNNTPRNSGTSLMPGSQK